MNGMMATATTSVPDNDPSPDETSRPAMISSRDLLGGRREIVIAHGDSLYRLRLTNSGKLILFK